MMMQAFMTLWTHLVFVPVLYGMSIILIGLTLLCGGYLLAQSCYSVWGLLCPSRPTEVPIPKTQSDNLNLDIKSTGSTDKEYKETDSVSLFSLIDTDPSDPDINDISFMSTDDNENTLELNQHNDSFSETGINKTNSNSSIIRVRTSSSDSKTPRGYHRGI